MRFGIDPISHRIGAMNVVRYGSVTAALGILLVLLAPSHPMSVVGWGIYGLGRSVAPTPSGVTASWST
jgi:hypothetical protein